VLKIKFIIKFLISVPNNMTGIEVLFSMLPFSMFPSSFNYVPVFDVTVFPHGILTFFFAFIFGKTSLFLIQTRKRKKKTKQMKALIYFEIIDQYHWYIFVFCHNRILNRNTLVISIPAAAEYL
jgi:hypothetical protein